MAARKKSIDFEKKLVQLESLVNDMEKGSLSLEDSLKAFEDAELKVDILTKGSDKTKPFESEND